MNINYAGPIVDIEISPNELSKRIVNIKLNDGYSYKSILITSLANIAEINEYQAVHTDSHFVFPVVNSKSPITVRLVITDLTKKASLRFLIEEFGQIPDENYFDNAFEPILVTDDDGNKHKVIPSDQFK